MLRNLKTQVSTFLENEHHLLFIKSDVKSSVSLLIFRLFDLSLINKSVLKFPTIMVDWFISPCTYFQFLFYILEV